MECITTTAITVAVEGANTVKVKAVFSITVSFTAVCCVIFFFISTVNVKDVETEVSCFCGADPFRLFLSFRSSSRNKARELLLIPVRTAADFSPVTQASTAACPTQRHLSLFSFFLSSLLFLVTLRSEQLLGYIPTFWCTLTKLGNPFCALHLHTRTLEERRSSGKRKKRDFLYTVLLKRRRKRRARLLWQLV
jgi:hypothetical protein